jgi:hypothetical protein
MGLTGSMQSRATFITSTYYFKELPSWVKQFNDRQIPDSLMKLGWNKSLTDQAIFAICNSRRKKLRKQTIWGQSNKNALSP